MPFEIEMLFSVKVKVSVHRRLYSILRIRLGRKQCIVPSATDKGY